MRNHCSAPPQSLQNSFSGTGYLQEHHSHLVWMTPPRSTQCTNSTLPPRGPDLHCSHTFFLIAFLMLLLHPGRPCPLLSSALTMHKTTHYPSPSVCSSEPFWAPLAIARICRPLLWTPALCSVYFVGTGNHCLAFGYIMFRVLPSTFVYSTTRKFIENRTWFWFSPLTAPLPNMQRYMHILHLMHY